MPTEPCPSDAIGRYPAADGVELGVRRWLPPAVERGAVLLLHGAASNGSRWWRFVEESALRQDHRLLRPDLRGHGASLWRGPADADAWCADLIALLDHEGLAQAVLVGHCLGANLAVHFAARHPQRCRGLVLVEPMLHEALLGRLARLRRHAWLLHGAIALIRLANRLGLYRRQLLSLDLRELDLRFADLLASPEGKAAMKGRYASPRHDLRMLPSAQYLQNLLEVLRPLPLPLIRCPTLALLSGGRFMADPERTRAGLAAIAHCEVRILDAEHWIPTEQPQAMREAIDRWVQSVEPA